MAGFAGPDMIAPMSVLPPLRPPGLPIETDDAAPPAILLVDDHDLFRAALRQLIEGHGFRVVGDCRCDAAAIDMARRTRANIVLIDAVDDRGSSSSDLIANLAIEVPHAGIIIFTRSQERADIYATLRAGARGYVAKSQPMDVLAEAINAVHAGNGWIQPSTIATVLEFLRTGNMPMISRKDMSDREIEVISLLARGHENNEIAELLGISGKTVKNHVSNILAKLEMNNRVQLAVFAVRTGIA
jgi:DNA-binding NarL/FixJ family response regulator